MHVPWFSIAIVGYSLGVAFSAIVTVYRSAAARRAASLLFVASWVAHLAGLVQQGMVSGRFPLSTLPEYLVGLGWIVVGLHLYLWFRMRLDVAGLVLPTIAVLSTLAGAQLLSHEASPRVVSSSGWFLFHTTVSTLGMATLCVAFAMSLLYVLQDRALKGKGRFGMLDRLPALDKCDRVGLQALVLGFALLTLGIGTGVVIQALDHPGPWGLGAKQVFPLLAWAVFAVVIGARTLFGFRGKKSAYMTILGFCIGLFTILGMNL